MIRLLIIFFCITILSLLVCLAVGSAWLLLFSRLFEVYFLLLAILGATSIAFSNYIDAVIKDIDEDKKNNDKNLYNIVVDDLISLKNEVLSNILLFIGIMIFNYLLLGFYDLDLEFYFYNIDKNVLIKSMQISLFLISLYILYNQISGYKTANEYKRVMSKKSL